MRVRLPKKQIIIATALLMTGLICAAIQNTFYGYVDDQGILHDSIFLPLSAILIFFSGALIIAIIFQILFETLFTKANKEA